MSYNEQLRCDYLTTNHEGALAWRMTPEWELYSTVVTMMGVEDKFYESGEYRVRRVADLVRKADPEFVARLAIYTRETMYLRSVPLLLLVELSRCHNGDSLVSRAVARTVQRADEIAELLMCYQWRTGKKRLEGLSCQLRRGLAEAFCHFDEYQFAKYDRKDLRVTLRDALLLVHPKPKDEAQAKLFNKILHKRLATPYTWETELSRVGKLRFESVDDKDNALKNTWQELVASGRLGYMAMLRNLRNMTNLCIDDNTRDLVCRTISSPYEVKRSRQLPFRFLSAYLQLTLPPASQRLWVPLRRKYWATEAYYTLLMKKEQIEEKLKNMHDGRIIAWQSKVCRYPLRQCIAYNSVIRGQMELRQPKLHVRLWARKPLFKSSLHEKNLMKIQKLERMLNHMEKRIQKLLPIVEDEQRRIGEDFIKARHQAEKAEKAEKARIANCIKENQRMQKRLKELGVSREMYIKPFLRSLEEAVTLTADNIAGFDKDTRVLLASDTSGSMCQPVSQNSTIQCYHIGLMLSMLMMHRCENAVTGMFGDLWKVYDMPSENILENTVDMIQRVGEVGYSTNGYKVIDWLIKENRVMDKVMLFTDCQLWNNHLADAHIAASWNRYKREVAPNARLYLFDLAGYGQMPVSIKSNDVFCIAGWSDKVFDILAALERGNSAIDEIRRIVV